MRKVLMEGTPVTEVTLTLDNDGGVTHSLTFTAGVRVLVLVVEDTKTESNKATGTQEVQR